MLTQRWLALQGHKVVGDYPTKEEAQKHGDKIISPPKPLLELTGEEEGEMITMEEYIAISDYASDYARRTEE